MALSYEEILSGCLLIGLIMLLWCYLAPTRSGSIGYSNNTSKLTNLYDWIQRKKRDSQEGYGSNYQPDIEENTMLMRGPWDDVDYQPAVLLM